jgi:hypothetical protein
MFSDGCVLLTFSFEDIDRRTEIKGNEEADVDVVVTHPRV